MSEEKILDGKNVENTENPEISSVTSTNVLSISDIDLDAIKETANIGTGNAATALSNLFKKRVNISLPDLKVMPLAEAAKSITGPKEMVVGIYSKIKEGMDGNILLMVPISVALSMTNTFLPNASSNNKIDENEKALLQKIGAATYISYLTSLAKFFKSKITFDPPNVISTFGESIFDFMVANVNADEEVMTIKLGFDIENTDIQGDFLLLFTIKSLKPLLSNIKSLE
ncbi:hypothetical protein C0585_05915 [Candidatus Woesearchaeota archaeon]|nr:MAG: hypothetical protein C0585_05915 [Candidatus Woesearchaeota archaeon]